MGKLQYQFNPATQYKNGFSAGYEKGKDDASRGMIELVLKSVMLSLWQVGWGAEDLSKMRDMICDFIFYNAKNPRDIDYLMGEMESATGVKITFSGENYEKD